MYFVLVGHVHIPATKLTDVMPSATLLESNTAAAIVPEGGKKGVMSLYRGGRLGLSAGGMGRVFL